jgi:hypothetical protein
LIFALLGLLSCVGCLLALRWGGEDGEPPFIPKWGLFTAFVLIGQWSVFQFLKELIGRIMERDETRISRRPEGWREL